MKKLSLTLLAAALYISTALTSFGQFSYSFTAVAGTYTANALSTTIIAAGSDDVISPATNIGFTFTYGCNTYTQFIASSNGWMSFNTSIGSSNAGNDLNTSTDRPMIAPLWDDLQVGQGPPSANNGTVNYKLTGTAPNRILTVEWKNMEWDYFASGPVISFQVKLYETSNQIEFVYSQNGAAVSANGASIGLSGPTSGQFYSLNGTGGAPGVSSVTETTSLSTKPASGQIYRWTNTTVLCSGTPTGGSASASPATTNCASLSTTLSLTGSTAGCGIGYQWQSSPDNSVWTNIAGATSATYLATNGSNTYYRCIITCTNSGLSSNSASILVNFSGAAPANDLPCNATALTLGVSGNGDNTCAGNASDPAPASCISSSYNTVWYSVVCPASGQLKIKTNPVSSGIPLQNTQLAVYSGTCSALTYVNCNDDAPVCGGYSQFNSELTLTGLTPGATYFIQVDGSGSSQGQFEVLAIDGTGSYPLVPGQDCPLSFPICNQTTTIGNPGYQVIGGQCDNTGSALSECTSGEANSVWYNINIGAAGTLQFDIVPNDYGNPNPITGVANPGYAAAGDETDYDWVLWKIVGSGSTSCASIMSSGGNNSSACNFSYLGVTGCSNSGNTPGAYGPPNFDAAYEVAPAVVAGEQYVLAIHNYSNSTSGFTVQFPGGSPVAFTPATTYYWSGGASTTSWTTNANWGGCGVPDCGHDADITSASSYQPVLIAGTYNVRDLTINAGATLTIQSGANLNICGNFTNNGNLICQAGSTITFIGTGTQNVTGSFVGADGFYHLVVTKASGTVVLNNNIDVKGNFTTSNSTSIFNSNSKYVKVAGNFTNATGNTTFTNTGTTGTLEFNGTAAQTYNQGSSQLDLNFVLMNHTGTGVTLNTDMFIKAATGTLTLTLGKINTGAFRVDVANSAAACVNAGNASSYINGNLYRTILAGGGSFEFPLGTSTLYERARLVFIANTYNRLQTRFDPWPSGPNTQGGSECTVTYSLPSENMGYWTFTQTGSNTGVYNTTLFCTGATNTAGANGWTVEKATTVAGPWLLNGTCAASTASVVNRNGMNGFSVLAAAQAPTPLPVQLTSFDGYPEGKKNILKWTTESEVNNSHFIIERSSDGFNYSFMGRVEGSGNSNTIKNYGTIDENPFAITYYRLQQVDYNGESVDYGPIVISNNNVDEFNVQNIYPNPAHQSFFVDLFSKNKLNADISIYDSYGRLVYSKPLTIEGLNTIEIQSLGWSSGVYMVKVTNESIGFQFISRIIIQ
jgi:hypothetical protein